MPFIVTLIFRKPLPSLAWHSQYFAEKVSPNYKEAQLRHDMYNRRTYQELDPLTLEIRQIWNNEEEYNNYLADPDIRFQQDLFDMYNNTNSITKETTTSSI
jgi:hypothetical protein